MAPVNIWVSPLSISNDIRVSVEAMDITASLPLSVRVTKFAFCTHMIVAANRDVDNDVFFAFDYLQALIDSVENIHIPDCTTIHESITMEVLRWEHTWYGRGGESGLRDVFNGCICLIKSDDFSS